MIVQQELLARAGEMAHSASPAALAEDSGLIPSNHMAPYNSNFSCWGSEALFWPPWTLGMHYTHAGKHTHTHTFIIFKELNH